MNEEFNNPPELETPEDFFKSFKAADRKHPVFCEYGKSTELFRNVPEGVILENETKSVVGWLAMPLQNCLGAIVGIAYLSNDRSINPIFDPFIKGCVVFGKPEKNKPLFVVSSPEAAFKISLTDNACLLTFTHKDWGQNCTESKDAGNMEYVVKEWSKAGYARIYAPIDNHKVGTYQLKLKGLNVVVLGLLALITQDIETPALKGELAELVSAQPIDSDSFSYGGGSYRYVGTGSETGVYFIGKDNEGNDKAPSWLCSPLRVIAVTSDVKSNSWGRLLEWTDRANVMHSWAMPMELLAGDGGDIRRELLRQGVLMNTGKFARDRFIDYLQMSPTEKKYLCVDRIGWHGAAFVLPDRTAGNSEQCTVFQNPIGLEPAFSQSGTLSDWITHIAQPAQGNSRLVFALSLSFAGALLELANEESGGFHLRGSSSIGKSTALLVASSVWGNPAKYRRQWRTTTNGLEGLAVLHNDGLLVLDEISQCEPRDIGQAVYMLSNQQGKNRANRSGSARNAATWRLLVLSSGEESLSALMNQAGQRTKAGQENRLADIAADAGASLGLFERLHNTDSPSDFAKTLNDAAATYYGIAGMAWVDYLSKDRTACTASVLAHIKSFNQHIPTAAQGQAMRVSRRFALVAAAGEMATAAGITGWQAGDAIKASLRCFNDWLVNFGGIGNQEERAILEHVRAFIEAHGSSRFESMATDNNRERINNRVGYFKDTDQGKQYLIFPLMFKNELCKGFDSKHVEKVLLANKWLLPNERGGGASKQRIPDQDKPVRMYVITAKLWDEDDLSESPIFNGNNGNSGNIFDIKGFNCVPSVKNELGTAGTKARMDNNVPSVPKPDLGMGTNAKPCNPSIVPSVPAVPTQKQQNHNQGSVLI